MDTLDQKLTSQFDGKVVRKDLLHRIKKGTNVPTFVLEFLLARYCASDDPAEIQAGMEAVLDTLNENYVRPNEANAAQSRVATKGKHRFIDKVHVNYVEKSRRHWAALENFDSRKVAISEKYYRDHDRLLQGGLWAEVTLAFNEIEDDDYAFYVEDLRPIQMSRFDFARYCEGRGQFTRDEWLDVVLRSAQLHTVKKLVARNLASTFLMRETVADDPQIVAVPFARPLQIRAGIVTKQQRQIYSDVRKLIGFVREKFRQVEAGQP